MSGTTPHPFVRRSVLILSVRSTLRAARTDQPCIATLSRFARMRISLEQSSTHLPVVELQSPAEALLTEPVRDSEWKPSNGKVVPPRKAP